MTSGLLGLRVRILSAACMCLSLVIDVCCQVEVTARGRLLVQKSPAECVCVLRCDHAQQ